MQRSHTSCKILKKKTVDVTCLCRDKTVKYCLRCWISQPAGGCILTFIKADLERKTSNIWSDFTHLLLYTSDISTPHFKPTHAGRETSILSTNIFHRDLQINKTPNSAAEQQVHNFTSALFAQPGCRRSRKVCFKSWSSFIFCRLKSFDVKRKPPRDRKLLLAALRLNNQAHEKAEKCTQWFSVHFVYSRPRTTYTSSISPSSLVPFSALVWSASLPLNHTDRRMMSDCRNLLCNLWRVCACVHECVCVCGREKSEEVCFFVAHLLPHLSPLCL